MKKYWDVLKATWNEFGDDHCFKLAAALSYYAVFSLAPMLVIIMSVAGLIYGDGDFSNRLFWELKGLVGQEGADMMRTMVERAYEPGKTWWAMAIGVGALIMSATTFFKQLQDSMNMVWNVEDPPEGFIKTLQVRGISFALILGVCFLLLISLILNAVFIGFFERISAGLPAGAPILIFVVQTIMGIGLTTLLFAMMFKYLPDVDIAWNDVWVGALVTAILFAIGRHLIGLYLGNSDFGETYGAAGALVIILLWVNYASLILFFGAEFTQVYANKHGSHLGQSLKK